MLYSERINQALVIATKAHDGQTRKGTDIPYITHPVAVALLASEYTDDEDVIIGDSFTTYSKTFRQIFTRNNR